MRRQSVLLRCLAWPLALLPLMSMSFSEVPEWFTGTEFRTLAAQVISQIMEGFFGALIQVFTFAFFGAQLPTQ